MKPNKDNSQERHEEMGMVPLRNMMNRLFDESFLFSAFADPFFAMPKHAFSEMKVDVQENDKEFTVKAELPGIDSDRIDLDLTETSLTITAEMGEETEEKDSNYLRRECSYGHVKRTFDLSHAPIDIEKSEADFKNGLLRITLPKKKKKQLKGKKIPINS